MSTEFNYVARLDTSQIMSGLSEIRSQVGMALGGAGGFGGGPLSATNFGGGASAGVEQMIRSMPYGMQGAATTLPQEMAIFGAGGMAAAGRMAPPGVSAGEFAFAAMGNNIDRSIQAREAASMAGEAALVSSAGGLLAGDMAMGLASPLGAMAGGRMATSMFGAGAAGAGRAVGGLAAGVAAMFLTSDYVGGKINEHYADVQQTMGITRELGDIVGSGRGLNRSQQAELGIAARGAAEGIKMDFNQFGDIMALARENGMMPNSTDPQKFKQQAMDFASAVREVSQTLHSSLADATTLIKGASQKGMGIEEAMIRSVNVGQGPDYSAMMYGMGAGVARGMGFTGAQGGQLFSGALGQAAGSGISGEEMTILGGRTGVAALIGGTQLQAAASPLGSLQLMAARGGAPLGGLMDLPGQALDAMSQGGDMVSNMGKFMVHQDEYRRGIGSKGVRAMAMQQLDSMGEVMSDLMPGLSGNEAKRMAAMQMYGMTGTQAEAYVGGMGQAPGSGDSKLTRATQIATLAFEGQETRLGEGLSRLPAPEQRASFGWGWASEGAMIGSVGGIKGAVIGGAVGLVAGNAKAAWQAGGDMIDDLGHIFDSSSEKADRAVRQAAATYDRSEAGVKDKLGFFSTGDAETAGRMMSSDISGLRLNMTSAGPRAMAMTESAMRLSGMTPVAAGPGTMQMGGVSWSLAQMQQVANKGMGGKMLSAKERDDIEQSAYSAFYDPQANQRFKQAHGGTSMDVVAKRLSGDIKVLGSGGADPMSDEYRTAANRVFGDVMSLTETIEDPKARAALQKDIRERGFVGRDTKGRAFLEAGRMPVDLLANPALQATLGLGSAAADTLRQQNDIEEEFLVRAFGGGGDVKDQMVMAKAMRGNKRYQQAKDMIKRHADPAKINAELKAAYQSAVVQRGGIEDSAKIVGGIGAPTDVGTGAFDVGKIDYRAKFQDADDKKAQALTMESMVLGEAAKGKEALFRKPGAAAKVHQRAVGFGEQEQAMSAINRSLQRTHSMIEKLDAKVSGGSGAPAVPSSGGSGSAVAAPDFDVNTGRNAP